MAEVVPLFGSNEESKVEVIWHRAEDQDSGLRRRVLEHLFLPREDVSQAEAA
ncbi:hypothetical protein [Streptomyces luteogriseus]|uniref:hypothetical protein n=1 Tax=Streptomyces luteogriseus TaxID=68233 RepID=UPI0037B07230